VSVTRAPLWRGWSLHVQRALRVSDWPVLVVLVLITVLCTLMGIAFRPYVPAGIILLPMVIGNLYLGPRYLPWFIVFASGCFSLLLFTQLKVSYSDIGRAVVVLLIALLLMITSFRRSRLGVSGPRGESMFVDLRDRISRQGDLPDLPADWYAESVMRTAGGTSFAGDFVVARRSADGFLDIVVVDVSGKGVEAGSRALFLSGAFNGIVSALPGRDFLPAANDYLNGQEWEEGFATALHLHLELATGVFELRKAGHPPAIWLHAGSGRWTVVSSDGPALGLIEKAEFAVVEGRLEPGDGLLMFTDGLVETSKRDISLGMDKLAGLGERLFQRGFDGGATYLLGAMAQTDDDRALVLVHRRAD
jgi:hypothetical protein